MTVKQKIHRILRRHGWEVQKLENVNVEYQVIKDVLRESGATVILDVGANVGQYGDLVLETGFQGRIISFEAIPEVHARLARHVAKRSELWKVAPCAALGGKRGQAAINLAGNSVSSSLLPMRREHIAAAPDSAYIGSELVQVERLDSLAESWIPSGARLMIKVDTQGYELEVLEGATALFPRTVALQIEMSLVPLYDGAPSLMEAVNYVERCGFELFSIVPGFKDKSSGRLLQADGVFVRRGGGQDGGDSDTG